MLGFAPTNRRRTDRGLARSCLSLLPRDDRHAINFPELGGFGDVHRLPEVHDVAAVGAPGLQALLAFEPKPFLWNRAQQIQCAGGPAPPL